MTDDAPSRLGPAIRARRKALKMTIVHLATAAGLSHPFVSQVERGRANPSFDSLARLARALGTSQIELMSGTALDVSRAAPGAFGAGEARMLTSGDTSFTVIDMSGDSRDFGDFYQHPEDEFVTVLSGMIVIDLGEDIAPVSVGESRYIRGNTPHRWASPDGAAYRVMIVKERMRSDNRGCDHNGESHT